LNNTTLATGLGLAVAIGAGWARAPAAAAPQPMPAPPPATAARPVAALPAASVAVSDAWVRWLPAGLPMGGYMSLRNTGTRPLRLIGARSASFGMVMLHRSEIIGGMARMVHVDTVTVPPGGSVRFAPGGYHLMLMQARDVKPGDSVDIDLQFAGHAPLPVSFQVRGASGRP
jgi:hypothetical protein